MTRAGSLLGQTVTVIPGGTSDPVTGVVSAVKTTSAGAQIVVNNTAYTLDQIALVSASSGNTVIPAGN